MLVVVMGNHVKILDDHHFVFVYVSDGFDPFKFSKYHL
jgi:hypothetical protein